MLVEKYGWAIQKSLFAETNQDSTFSHTGENSKMFDITSKYLIFFKNKPPASWVAYLTRDFLTCYSCSCYSFIVQIKLIVTIWSVFAFLNYVRNPFVNLLILSSNLVWPKALSHQNGKNKILYEFTKRWQTVC